MEIASYAFGKIADSLPALILRRLFTPEKVSRQIEIRLAGEKPVSVSLAAEVPRIDLFFEITNHSYLDLVLDRLLIDFWFGQPTFEGALLRRYAIPARNTSKNLFYKYSLTSAQQRQIEKFNDASMGSGQIHIYLTAYFQSKIGMIEVQKNLDRTQV